MIGTSKIKIKQLKGSAFYNTLKGYFNKNLKRKLFWSLFFASARIVFSLAWPYLLYKELFKNEQIQTDNIVILIPVVLVIFAFAQWFTFRQAVINTRINDYLSLRITTNFWHKMVSLEWLSFKSKSREYYFNIFLVDFWRIRLGIKAVLENILPYLFLSVAMLFFLFYISPPIFLLYLGGFLITALFQLYSNVKMQSVIRAFHEAWRGQSTNVGISVDKYDLIRMGRGYGESYEKFSKSSEQFLNTNSTMIITQARWKIIIQIVIQITRLAVLFVGIYWVKTGLLSWGEFFFTIFVIGIIQTNLTQLPNGINQLLEALESFGRINSYLKLDSEFNVEKDKIEFDSIDSIDIKSMDFSYRGKEKLFVFFNKKKEKGKVYLWVGPNGCGKSTLSHILLGLIKPNSGSIEVNHSAFDWEKLKQLRNRFTFIHQDALLFSGSVKENITFGHKFPDKAWQKITGSWLSSMLPSGVPEPERQIGERGEGLSGGEVKRLVLIREWLRSSGLIVLDEPLNHLDSTSVKQVMAEIESLKKNAIVVIISHQTGFESIADVIVEVNKERWNRKV